jgi:hypothetical protein
MAMSIRNLDWLRRLKIPGVDSAGARLFEIISDVKRGSETLEQQTNGNMNGNPSAPPGLQGMTVAPHENGFDVSIQHDGNYYRGVEYYVDYADNPQFNGARTEHLGQNRNTVLPLGKRSLYFQARAAYPWSDSTTPVYHGGSTPQPVLGGTQQTSLLPSQGCGTARPGQPTQGPGQEPFRSTNGAPPVRSSKRAS